VEKEKKNRRTGSKRLKRMWRRGGESSGVCGGRKKVKGDVRIGVPGRGKPAVEIEGETFILKMGPVLVKSGEPLSRGEEQTDDSSKGITGKTRIVGWTISQGEPEVGK